MLKPLFRLILLLAAFILLVVGIQAQPLPPPGSTPIHSLTLTLDSGGQFAVAGYDAQVMRGRLESASIRTFVEAAQSIDSRAYDLVAVQLMDDATGAVVYQTTMTLSKWIRGEFAIDPAYPEVSDAAGSNIEGDHLPWTDRTVTVRVPVIAGANRLSVSLAGSGRSASMFDLAAVSSTFGTRDPRAVTLIPLAGFTNGVMPENRVDIVILGDGYTAGQQAAFETDAKELADAVFGINPFSLYKGYFNVVAVFGASQESGADQPSCPDNDPPMSGQLRNTRYDSTYCFGGIARLLVPLDTVKMQEDATEGYPDWDRIFLVVNDSTYGGSGGQFATVSTNTFAPQILQHEVGHSLLWLDDEYDTFTPGYPPCSDYGRNGISTLCAPNVTDQTSRPLIKWTRWIEPTTPIPTTSDLGGNAGLWLGAHYSPHTYYRGCFNCIMKSLGKPYGEVAGEQLPVRLYEGYFGPDTGLDIIEPGTTSPDPLAGPFHIASAESLTFSFTVLSPSGPPSARVRWKVNGTLYKETLAGHLGTPSFTFTPINGGPYTVTAEVVDVGGILHSTQTGVSKSTRTWEVTADGYSGSGTELIVNGGFETPNPVLPKQPDGWIVVVKGKSKIKCDADPIFVAYEGTCAYQMKGLAGVTATLTQSATVMGDAGDAFSLSGYLDTANLTAPFSVLAKIKLADASVKKLKIAQLARDADKTDPYVKQDVGLTLGLDSADVTKIKVLMKFPGAGGKVFIDALSLQHYDEYLTSPPPAGRLGVPAAFRGSN